MQNKLLLIDGDQLLYQITSAFEVELPASDVLSPTVSWAYAGWMVLGSDYEACKTAVLDKLDEISDGYTERFIAFSGVTNFRYNVLPSYKGGRANRRKPIAYYLIMKKLIMMYPNECIRVDGLEGDDVLSILATTPEYIEQFDSITIWSQDKDMKQVPGVYLDNTKGLTQFINAEEADRFRYIQCLTGDSTDGYSGCPGVGPVKAGRWLDRLTDPTEEDYLDEVMSAYINANQTPEYARSQINCARILRFNEYNHETKQPILVK